MLRHTLLATAIAASLALPALAGAPPPIPVATPGAAGAGKHDEKREEMRAHVQEKIHSFVLGELTTRLSLDATKAAKLSDSLTAHMERKHAREKTLHQEMGKLNDLVESKASDAQLKAQTDVVIGAASRDDDMQAFIGDTSKYLSVQEQAKLALAMPDILKDVHKIIRDARREMKGKGGPPGGFGGGGPGSDEE